MSDPSPQSVPPNGISLKEIDSLFVRRDKPKPKQVTIISGRYECSLPKAILENHAAWFAAFDEINLGHVADGEVPLKTIKQFIQFVCTGTCQVNEKNEDWSDEELIYGAVRICQLGFLLGAPYFFNHGMQCIFETYYDAKTRIEPYVAYVCLEHTMGKLRVFMQDLLIRNWNRDPGCINTSDPAWGNVINGDVAWTQRFLAEVGPDHADNSGRQLSLQDYLMDVGWDWGRIAMADIQIYLHSPDRFNERRPFQSAPRRLLREPPPSDPSIQ